MAKTKVDEDKMGPALQRVANSDPAFQFHRDPETGQTIISGAGDTHLAIVVERLKKFGANVEVVDRKVPYRETVTHESRRAGPPQEADRRARPVRRLLAPDRAQPGQRIRVCGRHRRRLDSPPVHSGGGKGRSAGDGDRDSGGLSGRGHQSHLYDGSYHDVDSSEAAFIMAGIQASTMWRQKPDRFCWSRFWTLKY